MADPEPIAIATIRKNTREDIRVSLATYHGTQFIDVRTYCDREDETRGPTKKGVALRKEGVPELIEALQRAHGLIG